MGNPAGLVEPAARRTADRVSGKRGRAPGVWIRPAHGINDATNGVGEPASHQEHRTRRAQCSAHRACIWQHCPAKANVYACLRRRTTSVAGTSYGCLAQTAKQALGVSVGGNVGCQRVYQTSLHAITL